MEQWKSVGRAEVMKPALRCFQRARDRFNQHECGLLRDRKRERVPAFNAIQRKGTLNRMVDSSSATPTPLRPHRHPGSLQDLQQGRSSECQLSSDLPTAAGHLDA